MVPSRALCEQRLCGSFPHKNRALLRRNLAVLYGMGLSCESKGPAQSWRLANRALGVQRPPDSPSIAPLWWLFHVS